MTGSSACKSVLPKYMYGNAYTPVLIGAGHYIKLCSKLSETSYPELLILSLLLLELCTLGDII